jgi:exonuclease III
VRAIEHASSPFSKVPVALLRTFPGSVAVAEIQRESPVVVVSAYGIIDHGYAESTVHRILSDLTPLIDERRGRRIIVAGDLNITTQWSVKHESFLRGRHEECLRRDVNLFARFEALGLRNVVVRTALGPLDGCDCGDGIGCRHVQTQRHDRSTFPWQNDYFFVSEDLLQEPFTVEVMDQDDVWTLSSHCPIVVEFAAL